VRGVYTCKCLDVDLVLGFFVFEGGKWKIGGENVTEWRIEGWHRHSGGWR
jgi:hypothetical protein